MKVSKVPLAILVSLLFVTSVLVACGGAPAVTKTPSPSVAPSTAPATAKATTPASTKTYNLKFSHYGEPAHSVAIMGLYFAKEVEKRTQGRVKTEALFSGAGGTAKEVLKYTSTGVVDYAYINYPMYLAEMPLNNALQAPYATARTDVRQKAYKDVSQAFPALRKELEDLNIVPIMFASSGECIFGAKKPVRTLDDIKGLKVRAAGLTNNIMKALGAVPVSMEWGDVPDALQRGVIDAVSYTSVEAYYAASLHDIAKYITDPGVGTFLGQCIAINKTLWDSLPPDIRKVMEEVAAEAEGQFADIRSKANVEAVDTIHAKGGELITLSPDELKKWQDLGKKAAQDAQFSQLPAQLQSVGPQLLDAFFAACKKYEPLSTYKTPWEIWNAKYGKK